MRWKSEGSGALLDFLRWFLYVGLGWYIASANSLKAPFLIGVAIAFALDHFSEDWSEYWKEEN